jgi:two-component system sensor histidine kinase KdpD
MNETRPNPQQLLKAIQKADSQKNKGSLRIFLGMCPGVGKTYAMLKAAREQQSRSVKVLIGVVETHGRKETQELLVGMNVVPRKTISYKGTTLQEMDLDAILAAKPDLVLVDELAHTNVPGSRHEKRHQDVQEILDAGIDVYTTVNIQHIESRNDQVAQITTVIVKETVPDSFFETAAKIEIIDISPDELLERLKEGKVYLGDRAERAKENFFKEERLTALRELALRFTAEKVDQDLLSQMTIKGIEGPWNINERLLVAVSHSPRSGPLIRAARRMAYNLEAPWIALYVDNGHPLSEEDQKMLQRNISLARDLGAEVITIANTNITHAIQSVCRDKNVTQIVMGRPDRRFFRDLLNGGTFLDRLVRAASKVDIHVIRTRSVMPKRFNFSWPQFRSGFSAYYHTAWFLTAVSFLCYGALPYVGYRALGSVFLLAIITVAGVSSRGPILFASLVSALVWNYFFIPPRFTFVISSSEDMMMVLSFFVVGVVSGLLTSRIKRQEKILQRGEEQARALYELTKNLAAAKTEVEIVNVLNSTIDDRFPCQSQTLLSGSDRILMYPKNSSFNEKDYAVATWVYEHGQSAGWSTQTLSAATCLCIPMKGNTGIVGVFALYPNDHKFILTIEQENFLETVLNQAAIALERFQFSKAAETTKILEASEKLHQTLINSVSHELRTPITTIIGASTALKDPKTIDDQKGRNAMLDDLVRSANRLNRVVENLLDMSRLEKDSIELKKEWFEIHDLIYDVQQDLKDELQDREIKIIGEPYTLVQGDFRLLHHALANILLNATKYTPQSSDIEIEVHKDATKVLLSVKDHGPGIPKGMEEKLFEKFYRPHETKPGGIGLGLSIVKNIIELHGGSVHAKNRSDTKGAIFQWELPVQEAPMKLREIIE